MQCPDLLDGTRPGDEWRAHDPEKMAEEEKEWLPKSQSFLLMLADRKACKDGWVYFVGVDDKGRVLPTRCRVRAAKAQYFAGEWFSEGVPLAESSVDNEDTIIYEEDVLGWDDW